MPTLKKTDPGNPIVKYKDGKLYVYNESAKNWEVAQKSSSYDAIKSAYKREIYRSPGKSDESCVFDLNTARWVCPDDKIEYLSGGNKDKKNQTTDGPLPSNARITSIKTTVTTKKTDKKSPPTEQTTKVEQPKKDITRGSTDSSTVKSSVVEPTKKGRPNKPMMKKASDTTTGQYQEGEYIWDEKTKTYKGQLFSPEQQQKNYDAVKITYTGKKDAQGRAEISTPNSRMDNKPDYDRGGMGNSFQGQKGGSKLTNRNK